VNAALNGPTTVHSEYALLCDIVIATPDTVFQDKPHFGFGIVPGSIGTSCRITPRREPSFGGIQNGQSEQVPIERYGRRRT
jgi:enoyl-CoA hydratase/carnithine racemase